MVDVTEVSAVVAAAGVIIGVVYYALEIRHQDKMKHLDLFMSLYSIWGSEDMNKAHRRFLAIKVEDYDSFVKKYGSVASEESEPSQIWTDIDRIGWFFNLMGFLVEERIVNIKIVDKLLGYWVIKAWENVCEPLIYGARKQYNIPESYQWFEYLYNEMKKREQRK
jgi:hypothetical protein